jgi:peptide/nickel transport system permease protein
MTAYIIRRILQALPVLLLITIIGFAIIQATGDPLAAFSMDASLTGEDMARLRAKYGLDKPLPVQYLNWLKNMLLGDWGTSYHFREPVRDLIFERFPNTLLLVFLSYGLTLTLSIALGIISAVRQYSLLDQVVTGVSFLGIATPSFWLGLILIIVFAVGFKKAGLPYFPVGGMFDHRVGKTASQVLWHAILPAFSLSFVLIAKYTRYIRSSMLEQLQRDYIRTARAKGLKEGVVLVRHAFKNALLPVITLIGLDVPALLSGTIVIESIYSWPGMGRLFWSSAERTDIPPLMALLLFVAVLTVVSCLIADILYAAVDPRVRYS